jgi:hypothetical protein
MRLPGDTQTFAVLKVDLVVVRPSSPFLLLNHCGTCSLLSLPLVHASPLPPYLFASISKNTIPLYRWPLLALTFNHRRWGQYDCHKGHYAPFVGAVGTSSREPPSICPIIYHRQCGCSGCCSFCYFRSGQRRLGPLHFTGAVVDAFGEQCLCLVLCASHGFAPSRPD